jgi:hypothetical protein
MLVDDIVRPSGRTTTCETKTYKLELVGRVKLIEFAELLDGQA